jgi:hypothetical protein
MQLVRPKRGGQPLTYLRTQLEHPLVKFDDGFLSIDNNETEQPTEVLS